MSEELNEDKCLPDLSKNDFLKKQMRSEMKDIKPIDLLSEEEENFCQLFCNGSVDYAGNQMACYQAIYPEKNEDKAAIISNKMLADPSISSRIKEIMSSKIADSDYIKTRVTQSLLSVMDETRTASFKNKWGIKLNPSSLRAVSVQAARTLADIYGMRQNASDKHINIEGQSNVTFNVLVPNQKR